MQCYDENVLVLQCMFLYYSNNEMIALDSKEQQPRATRAKPVVRLHVICAT